MSEIKEELKAANRRADEEAAGRKRLAFKGGSTLLNAYKQDFFEVNLGYSKKKLYFCSKSNNSQCVWQGIFMLYILKESGKLDGKAQ